MDQQEPADLDLRYITPIVASDGSSVFISDNENIPMLAFFQIRKKEGNRVSADVVSAVRLNSLEDLTNLQKAIEEVIRSHRTKEK